MKLRGLVIIKMRIQRGKTSESSLDFYSALGLWMISFFVGIPVLLFVYHEARVSFANGRWCTITYQPSDVGQGHILRMKSTTRYGRSCDQIKITDRFNVFGDDYYVRQHGRENMTGGI